MDTKLLRKDIINLITTHTEKNGSYCDTGEDMEWGCRSECISMAVDRINTYFDDIEELDPSLKI
jgi:hypothetical protein